MSRQKSSRKGHASFETEGRLLQELGERLVARADVALMELIKNSYDADATECLVSSSKEAIEIVDDGHGMTESEFLQRWMRIATPDKQERRRSRRFKRPVTGSKGIGRFAVRFLGEHLRLETTALELETETLLTLSVDFDWPEIDAHSSLHKVKIPYSVVEAGKEPTTRTRLIITKLRSSAPVDLEKDTRTDLLALVDPYAGLTGPSSGDSEPSTVDPGFTLRLPDGGGEPDSHLASSLLDHAYARLTIEHTRRRTTFLIKHKDGRALLRKALPHRSGVLSAFHADIRYFPRRKGMFQGTSVDGRRAWSWIRKNGGVGIVDHGFRVRPYGFRDDDWLNLGLDTAHRRRTWRSSITNRVYPLPPEASTAKANPALYLPNSHQLIGAVFLETSQAKDRSGRTELVASMDREGFVDNAAYRELVDIVRGGLELLAYADHSEQRRIEIEKRQREAENLREDLQEAAEYIDTVPGLSGEDKARVAHRFASLAKELDQVEEYYQATAGKLEIMGLLGVLAGFVTHEAQGIVNNLDRILRRLRRSSLKTPETKALIAEIAETKKNLVGHLDYSTAFIGAVHEPEAADAAIRSRSSAELAREQVLRFAENRGISVSIEIEDDLLSPRLPRALYNGVLLNLLTNALKATASGTTAEVPSVIVVRAWNEPDWHVVEVADNGIGIPPSLRRRIWDPLFTTTSAQNLNPLGSGMGLGLTLVKQVVEAIRGKVSLVDPPPGYVTCFRASYRR